jgi:transcriptional regulator with XRE-family HTH domain
MQASAHLTDTRREHDLAMGERIRVRRRCLGMTQAQLGEHLGVSQQQIHVYECGGSRLAASMLVEIALRLDTTVADLVGELASPPVTDVVFARLSADGAIELLAAYDQIPNEDVRRSLVQLARAAASRRWVSAAPAEPLRFASGGAG